MGLNRSKYSQGYDRDEIDPEDLDEFNKMSFSRQATIDSFEANEIEDDSYQMSRKQRSYQNRRVMDRVRPDSNKRPEGGQR